MKRKFIIELYLWKLRNGLKYPKRVRNKIADKYRGYIYDYIEDEGKINSKQEIYQRFGTPTDVIEQYSSMITVKEKYQYEKERLIKILITVFVVTIISFFTAILVLYYHSINEYTVVVGPQEIVSTEEITDVSTPITESIVGAWTWLT